jgi:hypothetical protein
VSHDSARVRLSADAPQAQVLTSLALVLGARCDLSIEQIDDLVMALELLVREQPTRAREVRFNADDGLEVVVEDVTDKLLDERGQMLSVLVSDVRREAGAVRLRVI